MNLGDYVEQEFENRYENSLTKKDGIVASLPIVFGYFPVAMAFGLFARNVNIKFSESASFSIFVFAGASQFMALDLIKAGISTGSIIFATFLLNLRHAMMSASLAMRLENIKKRWLFFIAFGVTDETFSVASLKNGRLSAAFLLVLQGAAYISWVFGTLVGFVVGGILPAALQYSMGIGLYAMFTAILVPEIKKSMDVLFLSALSGGIYWIIDYFNLFPSGYSLIIAIITASVLGLFILKDKVIEEKIMEENE
jgi:4-azaleucine resistance transporter AzlC